MRVKGQRSHEFCQFDFLPVSSVVVCLAFLDWRICARRAPPKVFRQSRVCGNPGSGTSSFPRRRASSGPARRHARAGWHPVAQHVVIPAQAGIQWPSTPTFPYRQESRDPHVVIPMQAGIQGPARRHSRAGGNPVAQHVVIPMQAGVQWSRTSSFPRRRESSGLEHSLSLGLLRFGSPQD